MRKNESGGEGDRRRAASGDLTAVGLSDKRRQTRGKETKLKMRANLTEFGNPRRHITCSYPGAVMYFSRRFQHRTTTTS